MHTLSNSTFYDGSEISQRSLTLPRRHRRHMSSESTFVISSRDCSPIRRGTPSYCNESLPRSTHSIPATSSSQGKAQRTIPSKHLNDEHNRIAAKSTEIYKSPRRHTILDNKSLCDKDRLYKTSNSGPSSLESGKASSSMLNSGPSSLDSGKVSFSRTSGHSSLDSHTSASTVTTMQSPSRSVILTGSPKYSPNHNLVKTAKLASDTLNRVKSSSANSSPRRKIDEPPIFGKPPKAGGGIPNSNSNSSITLQVTTSNESSIPNTKIFVQNSPVRSVITLENSKLTENSNVFIINNETTTNSKGEFIKRTISKNGSPAKVISKQRDRERDSAVYSETELLSETGDSLSLISETSPDSSITPIFSRDLSTGDIVENSKFTKNINNDATMNNSRKLSLQIPHQNGTGIVYKNLLKNVSDSNPTSPVYNKNIFGLSDSTSNSHTDTAYERIAGSVGNLRYFEKNEKRINSNCDLKNLPFESPALISKLNSNPAINTDSIQHLLQKNIVTVGSEPNLAIKNCETKQITEKSLKERGDGVMDRRFSVSKDNGDDIFNFPSLTDLSFNFTSLAAQKILQGVSINSIDTLVELNLAQEKQQNNAPAKTAVCTDYGCV